MEPGAQWTSCHEQLGARWVIAVSVHSIRERVNVREIAPPRLIVIQPAFACGQLENSVRQTFPVSSREQWVFQKALGSDVVEEQ